MALITNQEIQSMIDDIAPGKIIKSDHIKKLAQKLKDQRQVHTGTELPDASGYEQGDLFFISGGNTLYIKDSTGWSNIQSDPYTKHLKDVDGYKCFIFYLRPDGNDSNDGLSWDTAKKSLTGIKNVIPRDLMGYDAIIYYHGGVYDDEADHKEIFFEFINGGLSFQWVGTDRNTGETTWDIAIRNGSTYQIPNNDQAVFNVKSEEGTWAKILFKGDGQMSRFRYYSKHSDGKHYFNKTKFNFVNTTNAGHCIVFENCHITLDDVFELGLGINHTGISHELKSEGWYVGLVADGTNSPLKTTTSVWNALVKTINHSGAPVHFKSHNWTYVEGHAPVNSKTYVLTNIKAFISSSPLDTVPAIKFEGYNKIAYTHDTSAKPEINIGTSIGSDITYDTDTITLIDISSTGKIIKKYTGGVLQSTTNYISSKIKNSGDSTIILVSTSVPTDAVLTNKDLVFYMDEATDTLKVKYKDSSGTIQTGNVTSLT